MNSPRAFALALALLAAAGRRGRRSEQTTRDAPEPEPTTIEVRIAAPGMATADVEHMVVIPIEAVLLGSPGTQAVIAEAREGEARLSLSSSSPAERVLTDLHERLSTIGTQLPESVDPPVLQLPRSRSAAPLDFALARANSEAARALLLALQSTPGVTAVHRCRREEQIAIELDPEIVRRFGLSGPDVEAAIRRALDPIASIDELTRINVSSGSNAITLDQLAAITVERRDDGCAAFLDGEQTTGYRVETTNDDARSRVLAQLTEAEQRGLEVRRFESSLDLWLAPELSPDELIGTVTEHVESPWLLEIDVDTTACAGPGPLARLHLPAGQSPATVSDALGEARPKLTVERPDDPAIRLWLQGPDLELLHTLAAERSEALADDPGVLAVGWFEGRLRDELALELDRHRLAELGIATPTVTDTITLALAGVELGELIEHGVRRRVLLRYRSSGNGGAEWLTELPITGIDGQSIPLGTVAKLEHRATPTRICRRNAERGIVVLVQPRDRSSRARLMATMQTSLPVGYRWLVE